MENTFKVGDKVKRTQGHDYNPIFNDKTRIFTVRSVSKYSIVLEEDNKRVSFDIDYFELVNENSMKEKININGKEYELDIDKAKTLGVLNDIKPKLKARVGGIYYKSGWAIYLLCVKVFYYDDTSYQLLGHGSGYSVYNDNFFQKLHTLDEISEYLEKNGYQYVKDAYQYVKD